MTATALSLFDFAPAPSIREGNDHVRGIIDAIAALLQNSVAVTMPAIGAIAERETGAADGSGAWSPRDAYDWAEAAAVCVLREMTLPNDPHAALSMLADFAALLPRQARRTDTTADFQVFSTPPVLGFLAARAAQISASDVVLEPSAGTGMLAVHAAHASRLLLNELEPRRRSLLGVLGAATGHDALYLRALLHPTEPPSVVLMNPPFSADANMRGVRREGLDLNHVAQAFGFLRPGGRLVAILGPSSSYQRDPRHFASLKGATLLASLVVGHSPFGKVGTSIGAAIVVLDKAGRQGTVIAPESELTPREALDAISQIPVRLPIRREAAATVVTLRPEAMATLVTRPTVESQPASHTQAAEAVAYDVLDLEPDTLGDGIFEPYRLQRIRIRGARLHPDALVESAALHAVAPPAPTYRPLLPPELVQNGVLSEVQIEALIYAGNAHEQHFTVLASDGPSSTGTSTAQRVRQGFLIGDGGGVGKGRTAAGIVLDNFARGRTKAIWISENEDLLADARRDWTALGGKREDLVFLGSIRPDAPILMLQGILFTTYATLRSRSKKTGRSRLDQVIAWVGNDFDGVIIMDESHNASNAVAAKGERGTTSASLQGAASLELQRRLSDARVVYQSATSASRIEAFSYAPRLGLWRMDGAFPSRATFVEQMEAGGLAALEIVARDLKAQGFACARSLSLDGITYERLIHELTGDQLATYAAANDAWRVIDDNVESALEACSANAGSARGAAMAAKESTKQRFYSALLVSFKMATLIPHAKEKIAQGYAPVFQLTNTNEAIQERVLARRDDVDDLDDLDLSPREYILDYLRNAFPVIQHVEYTDEDGNLKSRPLTDDKGNPVVNPDAVAARDSLLERLSTLLTPDGPLDMLLDAFGADQIAEVTGRKRRLVYVNRNGERVRIIQERGAHASNAETDAFQDGKRLALVFSEGAGGTGRSFHADRARANQKPRIHYLVQAGWRSDRALQGLFRSHRTNQAQPPEYVLVATNVPGERRFLSTIARRLDTLGALTRGQRDASGNGLFAASDNLESIYGQDALDGLLRQIAQNQLPGFSCADFERQTNLKVLDAQGRIRAGSSVSVPRFLNRLLAVDIDRDGGKQGLLMDALEQRMDDLVAHAKRNGTYDSGVQTIAPLRLRLLGDTTLVDSDLGKTSLLTLERTDYARCFAFADVRRSIHRFVAYHRDPERAGFYRDEKGPVAIVPDSHSDRYGNRSCRIVRPFDEETVRWAYLEGAKPISEREAEDLWADALREGAELETTQLYVVSGALLTVWHRLPSETLPTIYTMRTDDGRRIIGRVLDASHVSALRATFGLEHEATVLTPHGACNLARKGQAVKAEGVGTLRRVRVSGTVRLELVVPNPFTFAPFATACGALFESIDYRKRIFLPVGDDEATVLDRLLRGAPLAVA